MTGKETQIGVLIHSPYAYKGPNGVPRFILEMSQQLSLDGYRVRRSGPSRKRREDKQAGNVQGKSSDRFQSLGRSVKLPVFNNTQAEVGLTGPFSKERAEKLILAVKPDIVDMHEPPAGDSAYTLMRAMPRRDDGTPFPTTIGHFHSMAETLDLKTRGGLFFAEHVKLPEIGRFKLLKKWMPGFMHTVIGELDGRIAVSNATGNRWNLIYPGEYEVIPNGIDTSLFTPKGEKMDKWLEEVTDENGNIIGPIVMMGGRHDPRKRMDIGIKAFSEIRKIYPNAKLKITGEGKLTNNLKNLVHDLGLNIEEPVAGKNRAVAPVEFVDTLCQEELAKAYRTANIFMALSENGEGWGRVGVEAVVSGAYLVETSINGHLEAVGGLPFVWLVNPGSVTDTVRGAKEALEAAKEKTKEKKWIMHSAVDSRYSWSKITKETEIFYDYCMKKRGRMKRSSWPNKERKGVVFDFKRMVDAVYF